MSIALKADIPDFKRQLKSLKVAVRKKVMRRAGRSAAVVFRQAVKQTAPVDSGKIKRGIQVAGLRVRGKAGVTIGYRVKIKSGARYTSVGKRGVNQDAYYHRFVIRGYLPRRPGGKLTGGARSRETQRRRLNASGARRQPPNKFVDRAFVAVRSRALKEFNRTMERELKLANERIR